MAITIAEASLNASTITTTIATFILVITLPDPPVSHYTAKLYQPLLEL